jgi:hypothetical protein
VSGVESIALMLLASFGSLVVTPVVLMLVVGSEAVYEAVFGAILFAGGVTAVTSLGSNIVNIATVTLGAIVFDAVITAFTAVIFAFKLDAFLRHFFFWVRLPCPGPGMAECRK